MSNFFYSSEIPFYALVNVFFAYSFLGWVMECLVIRREKGVWENRGFAHSPFCVIYGFGAMLGYAVLQPLRDHEVLLCVSGALGATALEFATGCLMLRLFGAFWWDYSQKRFNYRGMVCLESTVAWGILTLLILRVLHPWICGLVLRIPAQASKVLAAVVSGVYFIDFTLSLRRALRDRQDEGEECTA